MEFRPSLFAASEMAPRAFNFAFGLAFPVFFGILASSPGEPSAIDSFAILSGITGFIAIFIPAVKLYFTRYIIDEDGVHVKFDLFVKKEKYAPWGKVTGLSQKRTLLGAVFKLDNLDVVAYGQKGVTLELVGLRNVDGVRDLVLKNTAQVK